MTMNNEAALVVFSGGQDSTTCLFWAKKHFKEVYVMHLRRYDNRAGLLLVEPFSTNSEIREEPIATFFRVKLIAYEIDHRGMKSRCVVIDAAAQLFKVNALK